MFYLIITVMAYIFLREYIKNVSPMYIVVLDILALGIILYTRYDQTKNNKNNYLFKKETKIPWFFVVLSFLCYLLYNCIYNIHKAISSIDTTSIYMGNKEINLIAYSPTYTWLYTGEQIIAFIVFAGLLLWIFFKDILEIDMNKGYYFENNQISDITETSPHNPSKENSNVEIIEELKEDKEKEDIKKIPVIVITKD